MSVIEAMTLAISIGLGGPMLIVALVCLGVWAVTGKSPLRLQWRSPFLVPVATSEEEPAPAPISESDWPRRKD